jgi:hypothetical protein
MEIRRVKEMNRAFLIYSPRSYSLTYGVFGVPIGEESKNGTENLFEKTMTQNLPKLMEDGSL